jgi:hypothetical protein
MILAIAIDPFGQQLVQFNQKVQFLSPPRASIPRGVRYSRGNEFLVQSNGTMDADMDFMMQSAILVGLTQSLDYVSKQLQFDCPSSNCTFPAFDSLAVCSSCNNLTSQLINLGIGSAEIRDIIAVELPNGASLSNDALDWNYTGGQVILNVNSSFGSGLSRTLLQASGTGKANETVTMQHIDTLIWAIQIIRINVQLSTNNISYTWPDIPLEAIECALF